MNDDEERFEDEYSDELEDNLKESAKNLAKKPAKMAAKAASRAAKEGIKKAGKAAAEAIGRGIKAVAKGIVDLFVLTLPWSAIALGVIAVIILIWVFYNDILGGLQDMFDAFKKRDLVFDRGKNSEWADFTDAKYEDDPLEQWLEGHEDADKLATWAQTVILNLDAGEKIWEEDPTHTASMNTEIQDLMRNEHQLLAQEDMIDILKNNFNHNKRMFQFEDHFYEMEQWTLQEIKSGHSIIGYGWVQKYPTYITTEDRPQADKIYENLSRLHIEGEKDTTGQYKFATHWQDSMALANYCAYDSYDYWGDDENSEFDYHAEEQGNINGTDNYFLTDEAIETIFNLFKYEFEYWYDGVADSTHSMDASRWYYKDIIEKKYKFAYRYFRLPDPDDTESTLPEAPGGIQAPFTRFVPESAPSMIHNSWETYKYIYIKTSEVPDYTPDPDVFQPPEGWFCIGRWKIVDPEAFINSIGELCPYYQSLSHDEGGKRMIKEQGFNWVDEMIALYAEQLEYLPNTEERIELFNTLANLYDNKEVIITYEGVKYDGMEDFVKKYEEIKPHGWTVFWDKSKSLIGSFDDEQFKVTMNSDPGSYPFWSYGVTYFDPDKVGEDELESWNPGEVEVDPSLLDGIDDDIIRQIIEEALKHLGPYYVFGAKGPVYFDCSGLVSYCFSKFGIPLSGSASMIYQKTVPVSIADAKPGDLVFKQNTYKPGISHIGIYMGNGKIVEAASTKLGIITSTWDYNSSHFAGFRRVVR